MKLWYQQPATQWTQALPLGNGRMGAMIYGNPSEELIALNEDTLWSGYPRDTIVENAYASIQEAKKLVEQRQFSEAGVVIDEHVLGPYTQSYLPFGNLHIENTKIQQQDITNYTRALDLNTAMHHVHYEASGVSYEQESFISAPHQVMVFRTTASKQGMLSLTLRFSCPLRHEVSTDECCLLLRGLAPSYVAPSYLPDIEHPIVYEEDHDKKGMRLIGKLEVRTKNGVVLSHADSLEVQQADEVEIRLWLHTSFNGYQKQPFTEGTDEALVLEQTRALSQSLDYQTLKAAHLADYQALYQRVTLSFEQDFVEMPTDDRLRLFQETQHDPHLYELIFQYGRYLTICSSRPGTQASNLQGIWNDQTRPPWSSNYTININTEMNYWPTEAANLSECHQPLFELIQKLHQTGQQTASAYYHARGATSHHNTDIWALSTPVGEDFPGLYGCAFWNMSFGWLSRHLFEHYEFSQDLDFLKEVAYPIIKDAALFYLDCLSENEDGYLTISPSTSPENAFIDHGVYAKISRFATMSNAIMREVFTHVMQCAKILEMDEAFAQEVAATMQALPPYQVGSKGQLLEWEEEFEEPEVHHRHISHVYPLYPAYEANLMDNRTLAEACIRSLEIRGDDGTGWSLGWKINTWARLLDGNHALKLLKNQLRFVDDQTAENYSDGGGSYANLFDAHPPFQIDGNFAACAGICEMLLQSNGHDVFLLPALPNEIGTGSVRGLRAKNGLTIDLSFEKGQLRQAIIYADSSFSTPICFHYKGSDYTHTIVDQPLILDPSSFGVS